MPTPEDLARIIDDLRRRISSLERANSLQHSSVLDASGQPVAVAPAIVSANSALAQALDAAVEGAEADGLVDLWVQADEPATAAYGDFWRRFPGDGAVFTWDGSDWVSYNDRALADSLMNLGNNIRTYWQSSPPTGSLREGYLWFRTDRDNRPYRWTDGAWQALQLGTNALAEASIDPSRLTIGVTGNLFQDPSFRSSIRTPPSGWTILGPDVVYPDSNFVRKVAAGDTTWTWTTAIPADSGRSVRVSAFVRPDTAALASVASLVVTFWKEDGSTSTVMTEPLTFPEASAANVWSEIEGVFDVPEGYTRFTAAAQVLNQTAGSMDFIKPEVHILWNRARSSTFVEGEQGWSLDERNIQFPNANIIGTLGADTISANLFELDGEDLANTIASLPQGVVSYARSYGTHTADIGNVRTVTHEMHGGSLGQGRSYRINVHGHLDVTNADTAMDVCLIYTTDGSTPVATGTVLPASLTRIGAGGGAFNIIAYYHPDADYENVKFSLAMQRMLGTGTARVYLTDINRALEFVIEDIGSSADIDLSSGGGGVLAQKSKDTGTAESDPVTTYTSSWYATWARSYDGNFDPRPDDTTDLYQGYSSTKIFRNQRSLFGFDYANIQSKLAGATIKSIKLTYRTKRVAGNDGIRVYLSSHNYTGKPSSFDPGRVNNDRINWGSQKEGVTYTHSLPLSLGNEFKSGTTRGLGFGPAPSSSFDDYYGYMYGAGTSRPKLTITYTK